MVTYTQIIIDRNIYDLFSIEDVNSLEKIICFDQHAEYFNNGRTCYYKLKKPIMVNDIIYKCVKLKGLGYGDTEGQWEFPGKECFHRPDPHIGFDKDGHTILTYSADAPFGGIYFAKAENEVNNFRTLLDNDITCLLPVELIKYDISFCGKPLGCDVILCEDYPPIRMNRLLISVSALSRKEREYFNKLSTCLGLGNYNSSNQLQLWAKIADQYGKAIRKMNEVGLCLHSGGWSNIQFSLQRKEVVLIDLDSVQSLNLFPHKLRALYALRDFISNLYRFLINLYNPDSISLVNESLLYKFQFPYYFLRGYFSQASSSELYQLSKKITAYYIHSCFNAIKQIESNMLTIPLCKQKKMELNVFSFYDYCLKLLYSLFLEEDTLTKNIHTIAQYAGPSITYAN